MNTALHVIGDVIHEIQRERGTACLYVGQGSQGKTVYEETLAAQFRKTDAAIHKYNEALDHWASAQSFPSGLLAKATMQAGRFQDWQALRPTIIAHAMPAADIINHCTDQLLSPWLNIMVEIAFYDGDNHPTRVTAYSNFLQWKESTGRERALGLRGFSTGSFADEDYIDWLKFQIADQHSSRDLFLTLANDRQKECLNPLIESPVEDRVEQINSALMEKTASVLLDQLDALDWFKLMSQKIDLMREVERQLVETLANTQTANANGIRLANRNEGAGAVGQQDQRLLSQLPLFSNLPAPVYNELLKHVQIDTHSKGKLLFLEGEQATRLYVILHGWVKLSKGNTTGEEAILQMFSSGDTLAESAVFLNVPLPETAQVVEPARIMAIPAPILRELVRKSNELAVNMLASMSRISRNFMRQIESIRLKTADERVGWFLLKLMLEQNRAKQDYVDLPFDKAVVASYLDMKPETLSRSLKRFRQFGFEVGRDRIRLPQPGALCRFCDAHLAANCDRKNTDFCAFNQSLTG